MPKQKPTTKKPVIQKSYAHIVKDGMLNALQRFVRRFFGPTVSWRKHRDIVKNNFELGMKYYKQGHISDAVMRFRIVTWLDPKNVDALYYLGCCYIAQEKSALGVSALKKAIRLKPDHEEARYMLAIGGGKKTPATLLPKKMPLMLARNHFDALAEDYTQEQLEIYKYQGHILLCNALRAQLQPGRVDHVMLELGPGTGLCGWEMRPVTAESIGVDISSKMLAQAMKLHNEQGRKIYDALIRRELHEFLQEAPAEHYDIVLASSVLSYVGDLQAVFEQTARVLRPGGIFAFTADKSEGIEYNFNPEEARFQFSQPYLRMQAQMAGLSELRFEEAETYPGYSSWLCLLRKP